MHETGTKRGKFLRFRVCPNEKNEELMQGRILTITSQNNDAQQSEPCIGQG